MGICEISDGDLKDLWHDQDPQEEPLCQDQGESSKQYHGEQEIDFLKKSSGRSLSWGCHMARSMQSDVEIDEMNIERDKSGKQGSSSDSSSYLDVCE